MSNSNSFTIGAVVSGLAQTFGKYKKEVDPVTGGRDFKLEMIINKFKAGRKLTGGELTYLAQNAPEIYAKAVRIMRQRQMLEQRLERAKTKEEADKIMMQEVQALQEALAYSDDEFEKSASLNQLIDAYTQYLAKRGTKAPAQKPMPEEVERLVYAAEYQQFKNSRQLFPLKKRDEEKDTYQREYLR